MGLFDWFPGTSTHQLNLDWILKEMKRLFDTVAASAGRIDGLEDNADSLQQALNALTESVNWLNENIGTQTAVELWRNAAPTSYFYSQLVTLADAQADCDMLMILVKDYYNNNVTFPVFVSREGGFGIAQTGYLTADDWDYSTHHMGYRMFHWEGRYLNVSNASADELDDDAACIPVAVYGFNLKF